MHWIDSNGISLRYELAGHGSRILVLLHEMGGCLDSWNNVVPALVSEFRVLRFDARGAGLSEKPRVPFAIDDLVDDLSGLLDALELSGPVALAGCAVGAAIALRFAARNPTRVSGIVAMAPATGIAIEKRSEIKQLADRFEAEGVRTRIEQRFDHSYPPKYFEDQQERNDVRGRLLSNDPYGYAATYRMLCTLDLDADLQKIQCPCLIVAGSNDTTRPPDIVERIARSIPHARFHTIDSGHAMPILTPALVADALLAFFGPSSGQ